MSGLYIPYDTVLFLLSIMVVVALTATVIRNKGEHLETDTLRHHVRNEVERAERRRGIYRPGPLRTDSEEREWQAIREAAVRGTRRGAEQGAGRGRGRGRGMTFTTRI